MLDNGVISQYAYNGDGDRVSQTVGGVTTGYVFDPVGLTQVLAETTAGQSTFFVPGLAQYSVTGWEYYGPDRLGSIRTLIDPAGELMLARNYDPFGNVLAQGGVGQIVFGYTGEQVDSTGLPKVSAGEVLSAKRGTVSHAGYDSTGPVTLSKLEQIRLRRK